MAKNDGGPAFPGYSLSTQDYGPGVRVPPRPYKGMSLHDWFAGMAMQGIVMNNVDNCPDDVWKYVAWSYVIADAMLAEREKEGESCDASSAG